MASMNLPAVLDYLWSSRGVKRDCQPGLAKANKVADHSTPHSPAAADNDPDTSGGRALHVQEVRFVKRGLAFRAQPGQPSPYNPPVRFLVTERAEPEAQTVDGSVVYAKLMQRELLTESIGRFRFSVTDAEATGRWKPGQYVALAFEEELGAGYSHMRDDDPWSLNDDLVRTFTVSSSRRGSLPRDEFEITIRNVGKVTSFLFRQNIRAALEVPIKGFAGSFTIKQPDGEVVPFIAGGIGITPFLAHLPDLDLGRIRLFWTINVKDIGLVVDTFERFPGLATSSILYVSGAAHAAVRGQESQTVPSLGQYGVQVLSRRMVASDVQEQRHLSTTCSVPLALMVSAVCLESILAAPVAVSPGAGNIALDMSFPDSPTSTTDACSSTVTPLAGVKRAGYVHDPSVIHDLDGLRFPQKISSAPCTPSSASSTALLLSPPHQARPTDPPAKLVAKDIEKAASNEGSPLGPLADLKFP
ncbi:MAG: hypothetical protein Q9208_000276 [Pyrenodesmia sp. 3 TL-2023]